MNVDLTRLWGSSRWAYLGKFRVRIPYQLQLDNLLPIGTWIRWNGIEFAKKRCKALRTWAIQILSGYRNYKETWVRNVIYRQYRIPKYQLFKDLVDALLSSQYDVVKTILAYLTSYKIISPQVGDLDSIVNTPHKTFKNPKYVKFLRAICGFPFVPAEALEETEMVSGNNKYAVDLGETRRGPMLKNIDSDQPLMTFATDLFQGNIPLSGLMMIEDFAAAVPEMAQPDQSLGRLAIVPEKGKARVVLIGNVKLQLKTKKLADWLRHYLWKLPEIASGNQQKMLDNMVSWLQSGWFVRSIDQSEATDRLSADAQVDLLVEMGVPRDYFDFMKWKFWYKPSDFGLGGAGLQTGYYSNGQPMGLFLSFPMFELLHYAIAKRAVLGTSCKFSMCGDDIVFGSPKREDISKACRRYVHLVHTLGGKINRTKTVAGNACEGVGHIVRRMENGTVATFLSPIGRICKEELSIRSWLRTQVALETTVGRAIEYSFLSPSVCGSYTYEQRRSFWEWALNANLYQYSYEVLNKFIDRFSRVPTSWSALEPPSEVFARPIRGRLQERLSLYRLYRVSKEKLADARSTTTIKKLYKMASLFRGVIPCQE